MKLILEIMLKYHTFYETTASNCLLENLWQSSVPSLKLYMNLFYTVHKYMVLQDHSENLKHTTTYILFSTEYCFYRAFHNVYYCNNEFFCWSNKYSIISKGCLYYFLTHTYSTHIFKWWALCLPRSTCPFDKKPYLLNY